ncbi:MAG: hypothetical protein ISS94_04295 [Candidatus Syntrophoarchaeum sp.]|nr:hypothetical protein [Candidatus Syntrophoarchaeum sp.]
MHISTDIGGTFTDFVIFDGEKIRTFKVPSTPEKPELAIQKGLEKLGTATLFSHGATIATNSVLERKGAKIGLITTKGFADILKIKNGMAVSCSSEVLPEFREYERTSTTVLDAYLKIIVERYITNLEAILAKKGVEQFYVMQSNGGVVKARVMKIRFWVFGGW